ncbi:hypothetical protein EJB05_47492 [Eragrostis curvula]|uniref:Uncharacterized protein n=1 Tax=Eragrostis curvula TaxID=38414 RepID=A0A5J9T859_9POAL|nr:hypothetical protein EJB05_47492 [Eragrostis curvula]
MAGDEADGKGVRTNMNSTNNPGKPGCGEAWKYRNQDAEKRIFADNIDVHPGSGETMDVCASDFVGDEDETAA